MQLLNYIKQVTLSRYTLDMTLPVRCLMFLISLSEKCEKAKLWGCGGAILGWQRFHYSTFDTFYLKTKYKGSESSLTINEY